MTIFLTILNLITGLIGSLAKLRSYRKQIRHAKLESDSVALGKVKTATRARRKIILARQLDAEPDNLRPKPHGLRKTDRSRDKYRRD